MTRITERGFSAVQFAVTVALGGLFMLMALKAAPMVDAVRAFTAVQYWQAAETSIRNFHDRYGLLPGDGRQLPGLFGRPASRFWRDGGFVDLAGNRVVNGLLLEAASPEGEQYAAWRDMRLSGFYPGDGAFIGVAALPDNPFGGVFGFSEVNLGLRQVLCMTNVPGSAAAYVDRLLDDGIMATGNLRGRIRDMAVEASGTYPVPGDGAYRDDAVYLVCKTWRL